MVCTQAIVLSHLHQYVDCLALLEPLYNRLEPLDEGAAITICLLMVHMWLEARQPAKVHRRTLLRRTGVDDHARVCTSEWVGECRPWR